jgi:hypothetical protein
MSHFLGNSITLERYTLRDQVVNTQHRGCLGSCVFNMKFRKIGQAQVQLGTVLTEVVVVTCANFLM